MLGVARYGAIVLAGGAGKRLGGPAKPTLEVRGRPMLYRVLEAVAGASSRVVVGPPELPVPAGVVRTQERPPGGGPVAATAAGLTPLPAVTEAADETRDPADIRPGEPTFVALLAADLPLLTAEAVERLLRAATGADVDGAVFVDGTGRAQWLCGVWRTSALRVRLAALGDELAGASLRVLLGELRIATISTPASALPAWWDCDTEADLRRAERWA